MQDEFSMFTLNKHYVGIKHMVSKIITRVERSIRLHICIFSCVCVKFSLVEQTITIFFNDFKCFKEKISLAFEKNRFQKTFYRLRCRF